MPIASLIYPKLALNLFLTNILNELFPDSIKYIYICLDSIEKDRVYSEFLSCMCIICNEDFLNEMS